MALQRKTLGPDRIELSPFTFGTMRLSDERLGGADLGRLFGLLEDGGVDTFHSSDEYDSFPIFSEAVRRRRTHHPGWQPRHIVKVAEPSFGQDNFDHVRFRRRLEAYLRDLGSERMDVVQWMLRSDTADTPKRLNILHSEGDRIGECFDRLRVEGKIGAVVVFPYAPEDVEASLVYRWCDGLAVYLNLEERQWLGAIEAAGREGRGVVTIRPFGTGKAVKTMASVMRAGGPGATTADASGWQTAGAACVGLPLLHPSVVTTVGTATSAAHLRAVRSVLDTRPNRGLFGQLLHLPGTSQSSVMAPG